MLQAHQLFFLNEKTVATIQFLFIDNLGVLTQRGVIIKLNIFKNPEFWHILFREVCFDPFKQLKLAVNLI